MDISSAENRETQNLHERRKAKMSGVSFPPSPSFAAVPLSSCRPIATKPTTYILLPRLHSPLSFSSWLKLHRATHVLRSSHQSVSGGPIPISQPSSSEAKTGKLDPADYEALLRGGEQVTSVLEEMVKLLEDVDMDEASEAAAVEIAAQGVIGKRVDEMESGFMMALDYMIQIADKDGDDQVQGKNL